MEAGVELRHIVKGEVVGELAPQRREGSAVIVEDGIPVDAQVVEVLGHYFVAEAVAVLVAGEGVVGQRDVNALLLEADDALVESRVAVAHTVGLIVGAAVVHIEDQVFLVFGDLDLARFGDDDGCVAVVLGVVVHHQVVHHSGLVVLPFRPQGVTLDAVVEHAVGNLDLIFGAADVVAQGVDVLVGHRDQFVRYEESADGDQERDYHQREHSAADGDAGGFHRQQFVVLSEASHRHNGCQKGGQRQHHRQDGAGAPAHKFGDDAQTETLADKLVDVYPQELHHKDEQHDEKHQCEGACE